MVARGMRDSLSAMCGEISDIRLSGGVAGNPLLAAMLADVLGQTVKSCTHKESSVYGAVLLAHVALGIHTNLDEAAASVAIEKEFPPEAGRVEVFHDVWRRWDTIHRLLEPAFNDTSTAPLEKLTV